MKRLFPVIAVVMSSLLGFLTCEIAYRVKRFGPFESSTIHTAYRIGNTVYGQFDKEFGQQFLPNSGMVMTAVRDGRVIGCLGEVVSANEDGLGGKDTFATYERAKLRLITTGDSFTHWKQNGMTIPDIVAERLSARTGNSVANLNFGRGTYGMLHMLNIGSRMATVYKPDLLVVQFITDDLTRGWWWTKELDIDGRKRPVISASEVGLTDGSANDEYIVESRATEAWCEERLAKQDEDAVLSDANSFYSSYRKAKGLVLDPWSFSQSYVLRRIFFGHAMSKKENAAAVVIPRIGFEEFERNPIVLQAIAKLRQDHAKLVFVHIPTGEELTGGLNLSDEQRRIWQHIEMAFETRIITAAQFPMPPLPAKIDLMPVDGHPNYSGIQFYGEYVTRAIEKSLAR